MERMTERMISAGQALERLHEATAKETLSSIEKDGLIQRFEFCFEILWKCGKDYLLSVEGLEAASPKKVIRLLRETDLFTPEEAEQALMMADDRNMASHTYDEKAAEELIKRIYGYEALLKEWHRRMTK